MINDHVNFRSCPSSVRILRTPYCRAHGRIRTASARADLLGAHAPTTAPTLAWSGEFQALFKGTGQALQRGLCGIASPALDPADVGLADPGPL